MPVSLPDGMIVVSACLLGVPCRYDAASKPCEAAMELLRAGRALPVCPEQLGGLPAPRQACEMVGDRVLGREGGDFTAEFLAGAAEGVRLAREAGCRAAVLKAFSPSCGCGIVYDGSFSGRRIAGDGVFAQALKAVGIAVHTDEELA